MEIGEGVGFLIFVILGYLEFLGWNFFFVRYINLWGYILFFKCEWVGRGWVFLNIVGIVKLVNISFNEIVVSVIWERFWGGKNEF